MEKIIDYLVKTCHQKPEAAVKVAQPFAEHDDIRTELEHWIETQEYLQNNPLTIEGYTAKKVSELAPFMNGVGVYNFLVTLRERPDNAKRIIAEGFPRK
jgi:hypothetical protein